ncbi:MAG: amino acid permease [Chlorobi bacterium]|nr:amino acid permease [Chlorobiota bacterium]MCI0714884.1 amino acid permease [Chlorobiota bacterium]
MEQKHALLQRLGLFTAVTVVVGSMIGSGIFKKSTVMSAELGAPGILLAIWLIAGLVSLIGALTNAEVAGILPRAGGQYVYFREMYGRFFAYLYGWSTFSVIQTASIAAIAYVFSGYLEYFFPAPHLSPDWEAWGFSIKWGEQVLLDCYPLKDIGLKMMTIILIMFLSTVNYFGVVFGGIVQGSFTVLKNAAIAFIVIIALASGVGSAENFSPFINSSFDFPSGSLLGAVILALSGAFWAYDGWNNITYLGAEVKEPQRNIPKAMMFGMGFVIVVYMLINLAYLYVLPVDEMKDSSFLASDVMQRVVGNWGGAFVAIAVMVSTFGTTNGTILVSARVYYAMARDGLFFKKLEDVHHKYRTPGVSLLIQGLWASAITMTGSFDQLTDMLIFVSWIFYGLGAYGVFVLRKKMPNAERPYKAFGYPVLPIVFVLFSAFFVGFSVWYNVRNAVFGLILVVIGIPLYFWFRKKQKPITD